jgi:Arabinose efflux permease
VLLTLASAQFVMALDMTVMNTAIATVARDVGTDVTGIQLAITLYTLVMASFMITGGRIGEIIGRKRAFTIGCVVYASGSLTTALSTADGVDHRLVVPRGLRRGVDLSGDRRARRLELRKPDRPRAYGLVAAAGAMAAAVGPVIGGFFTTYASWRWVLSARC